MPRLAPDETIYFPERPAGRNPGPDAWDNRYFRVCWEDTIVAAYNSTYFPTVRAIAEDVKRRADDDPTSGFDQDLAIWRNGCLFATVHEGGGRPGETRITIFGDRAADNPGPAEPLPGWPTREQWIADGAGRIVIRPRDVPPEPGPEVTN